MINSLTLLVFVLRRISDFPMIMLAPSKSTLHGEGGRFKKSRSSMKSDDSPGM